VIDIAIKRKRNLVQGASVCVKKGAFLCSFNLCDTLKDVEVKEMNVGSERMEKSIAN
jgi:hypothetical protein